MKTLKFLLTVFVMTTFLALNSFSQGNEKTTYEFNSVELENHQFPGLAETVTGSYSGFWTVWNFKTQWRGKGTYVGDDTGIIYYTHAVENYSFKDWMPGSVKTGTGTIHIRDEFGTIYYKRHYVSHITINANGEITADVFKENEFLLY